MLGHDLGNCNSTAYKLHPGQFVCFRLCVARVRGRTTCRWDGQGVPILLSIAYEGSLTECVAPKNTVSEPFEYSASLWGGKKVRVLCHNNVKSICSGFSLSTQQVINVVVWSPCGKFLAAGAVGGTLSVWDVEAKLCIER